MYIYMVYVVTCRGVHGICIYMVYVVTCRGYLVYVYIWYM